MFHEIFRKSCRLWDDVDKYGTATQATGDNIIRRRKESIFMENNWGKNTDTIVKFNTYCFMSDQFRLNS